MGYRPDDDAPNLRGGSFQNTTQPNYPNDWGPGSGTGRPPIPRSGILPTTTLRTEPGELGVSTNRRERGRHECCHGVHVLRTPSMRLDEIVLGNTAADESYTRYDVANATDTERLAVVYCGLRDHTIGGQGHDQRAAQRLEDKLSAKSPKAAVAAANWADQTLRDDRRHIDVMNEYLLVDGRLTGAEAKLILRATDMAIAAEPDLTAAEILDKLPPILQYIAAYNTELTPVDADEGEGFDYMGPTSDAALDLPVRSGPPAVPTMPNVHPPHNIHPHVYSPEYAAAGLCSDCAAIKAKAEGPHTPTHKQLPTGRSSVDRGLRGCAVWGCENLQRDHSHDRCENHLRQCFIDDPTLTDRLPILAQELGVR
jgi:hypothetical protein